MYTRYITTKKRKKCSYNNSPSAMITNYISPDVNMSCYEGTINFINLLSGKITSKINAFMDITILDNNIWEGNSKSGFYDNYIKKSNEFIKEINTLRGSFNSETSSLLSVFNSYNGEYSRWNSHVSSCDDCNKTLSINKSSLTYEPIEIENKNSFAPLYKDNSEIMVDFIIKTKLKINTIIELVEAHKIDSMNLPGLSGYYSSHSNVLSGFKTQASVIEKNMIQYLNDLKDKLDEYINEQDELNS